jgi:DTW domain-containing protein YfiP
MHPKEFQKTKNGTGYFTHLSLSNSKIFKGINFTNNTTINALIDDINNNCFILYPGEDSIKLNHTPLSSNNKRNVIFIIDSTWACSVKMLRESKNLHNLPRVSFEHNKISQFKIKTQPKDYCLSTIESTLCILELLNDHNIENIPKNKLDNFLLPFQKMVEFQVKCSLEHNGDAIRYKKPYKK